jgi:hypothetical protein
VLQVIAACSRIEGSVVVTLESAGWPAVAAARDGRAGFEGAKPECRGQVSAVVAEMVAEADSIDDLDREALVFEGWRSANIAATCSSSVANAC